MDNISYIADIFSIIAFGVTIWTLFNVKKVKQLTKEAIKKFDRTLSIADLSKAFKTTDEIHGYLGRNEFSLAVLRMNDLRVILSQLETISELKECISNEEYEILVSNFYLNIENLKKYISDDKIKIKLYKISADLNKLSKIFLDLENKLKRKL